MTWKEIKDYINQHVTNDSEIIEPDKCLYFAILHEGRGITIENGNATSYCKPYYSARLITNYGMSIPCIAERINKSEEEVRFMLEIADIDPEKGHSEDLKFTNRQAKILWEMDFQSCQEILRKLYL